MTLGIIFQVMHTLQLSVSRFKATYEIKEKKLVRKVREGFNRFL